jgi:hypothetical protein
MAAILQWNCRGVFANYEELTLLIRDHLPLSVCLQDLILGDKSYIPTPRDYSAYISTNLSPHRRGGAGLLLHNSVQSTPSPSTRIYRRLPREFTCRQPSLSALSTWLLVCHTTTPT